MNLNMKKTMTAIATSLVAFTAILSAADASSSGSMKSSSGANKNNMNNPNGGVQGGYDVSIDAAALLWKAQQGGTEFATTGNFSRNVKDIETDFAWGFRVGLGYTMPHDRWNVHAGWDHFHAGSSGSVGANWTPFGALAGAQNGAVGVSTGAIITPANGGATYVATSVPVHSHWNLKYDTVDLALKRDFQFSKWVCVAPHFGLRSAWVYQHQNFDFNPGLANAARMESKNHFWGLGIRSGFDTQWGLGRGWSIYGNAAAALLWGNYHVNSVMAQGTYMDNGGNGYWSGSNNFHASRACGDFQLGLRWNKMFSDNRYGLTIQVGYEQHIYWNMYQATQPAANAHNGDLTFVGWTGAAKFDF